MFSICLRHVIGPAADDPNNVFQLQMAFAEKRTFTNTFRCFARSADPSLAIQTLLV
jgi:hypothetical protein